MNILYWGGTVEWKESKICISKSCIIGAAVNIKTVVLVAEVLLLTPDLHWSFAVRLPWVA